ncbi:THUMP domain-containing protein 1 [Atheta coriaria]|uniref:THUMP domain-containing protein 1 n=1 Tax=Dalotia coriaria TaxID=877792 RepID=UPI0031F34E3C
MSDYRDNKKRKQYYGLKYTKRARTAVEAGLKGFLCSCNGHEKECVKESYNILNKFADILYKPQNVPSTNEKDIEDDLSSEIASLKKEFRFNLMESGAKNLLFIKTSVEDPVALATTIVKDVQEQNNPQTRFLVRLVPIQQTCKAFMEDITAASKLLLDTHLPSNKTFSIVYNHRNNNNLNKEKVIQEVAAVADSFKRDNKVNLKQPDVCIIIEVIKNIVFLSVVPDYVKYKKFNLLTGTVQNQEKSENNSVSTENKGDDVKTENVDTHEVKTDEVDVKTE